VSDLEQLAAQYASQTQDAGTKQHDAARLSVVPELPPLTVKASEGFVPTELSKADDGQPLDMQPSPLFSSQ
jgi:hypothetical protein